MNDLQGFLKAHRSKLEEKKAKEKARKSKRHAINIFTGDANEEASESNNGASEMKLNLVLSYLVDQSKIMEGMKDEIKDLKNQLTKQSTVKSGLKESEQSEQIDSRNSYTTSNHSQDEQNEEKDEGDATPSGTSHKRGLNFDKICSENKKRATASKFKHSNTSLINMSNFNVSKPIANT